MLAPAERTAYEAEAQQLRRALKTWETAWARDHGGAKPGRADIKQHADIALQYTAYNRVRGILAGTVDPTATTTTATTTTTTSTHKRKQSSSTAAAADAHCDGAHVVQTPAKRRRSGGGGGGGGGGSDLVTPRRAPALAATPTPSGGGGAATAATAAGVTPSISRRLFSPAVPTSIGPTPQRDGRVLGLFDVLGASPAASAAAAAGQKHAGAGGATAVLATPRKAVTTTTTTGVDVDGALGTTPLQARDANRDAMATTTTTTGPPLETPSKRAAADAADALPTFATPAFLRRQPAPAGADAAAGGGVDENGAFVSPSGPQRRRRFGLGLGPRRPPVRGLSSMLASLRRMEDEQLDEQMDVLREMEEEAAAAAAAGGGGGGRPASTRPTGPTGPTGPTDATEALPPSRPQEPALLGGFDDEGLYDSAPETATGRDGQPLRVYKKKGQKRTTRRANMRPTRTKRPAAVADESESEGSQEGDGNDDDYDGNEDNEDNDRSEATTTTTATTATTAKKDGAKTGAVKKAVRKVNELAHANFKRLKLRNTGSKGGAGVPSRFRRRR